MVTIMSMALPQSPTAYHHAQLGTSTIAQTQPATHNAYHHAQPNITQHPSTPNVSPVQQAAQSAPT